MPSERLGFNMDDFMNPEILVAASPATMNQVRRNGDSNDPKKGENERLELPIKNGKFTQKKLAGEATIQSRNSEPSVHGNLKLRKWRNTERLGKRKKRRWTVDGRVDPSCKRLAFHAIHFMP